MRNTFPTRYLIGVLFAGFSAGCGGNFPPTQPGQPNVSVKTDVSGTYTLTFERSSCATDSQFPETLRVRTYVATVHQNAEKVSVDLQGADFASNRNHFTGQLSVGDGQVWFYLNSGFVGPWDYGDPSLPDVAERLSDGFLSVNGLAIAAPTANGLSGNLNGSFTIYDSLQVGGGPIRSDCQSKDHRFSFVRSIQ